MREATRWRRRSDEGSDAMSEATGSRSRSDDGGEAMAFQLEASYARLALALTPTTRARPGTW